MHSCIAADQTSNSLDQEVIDKLGKGDEVGKVKWNRLCEDKQFKTVYAAVSNEAECEERLEGTNFHTSVWDIFSLRLEVMLRRSELRINQRSTR